MFYSKKLKKFSEINHCFFSKKVATPKEYTKDSIAEEALKIIKIIL